MIYILLALLIGQVAGEEWDAANFPNPTVAQFRECGMRTRASVCDPDGVLSEAERYRLDHELKQLESRTRQEHGSSFCEKKGITPALAIARHVRGGSTEAVKTMANDMLRRWTLDSQCQKAIVIVVSTDDMKFWVARDDKVPVYADEFTDIFMQQKRYFQQSDYQQGISNVLKSTWEKANSKAGSPQARPDSPRPAFGFGDGGGGSGGGGQQPYPPGGKGAGGGGPALKMPSIPGWFWMALIFGIIPLLCCCCCLYLCCCRGKGGGATEPRQPDQPRGPGMGGEGGGGGGRSPFSNLITSMGGAGIGSLIGNMISGRNRGGGGGRGFGGGGSGYGGGGGGYGGGGGGYGGGGGGGGTGGRGMGYDPSPVYDDNQGRGGRGLYPSAGVKDQGGGGGW